MKKLVLLIIFIFCKNTTAMKIDEEKPSVRGIGFENKTKFSELTLYAKYADDKELFQKLVVLNIQLILICVKQLQILAIIFLK